MIKTALSVVFYLLLAGLILLVLLTGGMAESGKPQRAVLNPENGGVKPISPYEQARRIVGLALSECWERLGENPVTWAESGEAHRREVTTQLYVDCTIKNLESWHVVEVEIDPIK